MALVHKLLLLSRHLKVRIIIHLLLVWVASLHWLHSSLHVLLMLTLHLHLLLIVLIGVVCQRLVEIAKIEFVVLVKISHP